MSNVVEHPNRPSVRLKSYRAELLAQACAAEQTGSLTQPAILRAIASRVGHLAMGAETHYETKVSDLIAAAQDVLSDGGFAGTPDAALIELARCVHQLRYGTRSAA